MLEQSILLWIQNNLRNEVLTPFVVTFTNLGNEGILWIILSILLVINPKTRKVGFLSLLSLAITYLIGCPILKNLFVRTRPYEVIDGLQRLIGPQGSHSFPSGHTASAFSCAVVIFLNIKKRYGIPVLTAAFLMGFSRLYVGVHYPTDVLCGALLGTIIAILVSYYGGKGGRGFMSQKNGT